jgi:transketolase N-terminal domain/subunit
MAGLERIEVERIERNKYRFYRVLGSEDRQAGRSITDAHLFAPSELLELATYVEQNRAQLEQEAHEDEERDARAWSEDMKDMEQIKREWREYREG